MMHRIHPVIWLLVALAGSGCSRLPDTTYHLRAETEKLDLPAKHKAQIATYLAMFHGTPANPKMAMPDEPAVEKAYSVYEAVAEADDPAAAKDRPVEGVYRIAGNDAPGFGKLHLQLGREVYTRQCAGCHGTTGDGKGPAGAYLNPPPRDYRNGVFKFTSTPRGSKPRREDLRRILKYGAKGTSMPAFRFLSEQETEAVIDYVMVLASRGELEIALLREAETELDEGDDFDPEVVAEYVTDIGASWKRAEDELVRPITVNPPRTPDTIHAGAIAFAELYCVNVTAPTPGAASRPTWGKTFGAAPPIRQTSRWACSVEVAARSTSTVGSIQASTARRCRRARIPIPPSARRPNSGASGSGTLCTS